MKKGYVIILFGFLAGFGAYFLYKKIKDGKSFLSNESDENSEVPNHLDPPKEVPNLSTPPLVG